MPGRLGKNLRSGHIAEDIGILFLRSFCAVAKIRQEDDYGTDAIATLLREESGLLHAENTFYVQIKSKSVHKITYDKNEIKWLLDQDLPLFILSVDKIEQELAIYTTNPVYELAFRTQVNELEINFESLSDGEYDRVNVSGDVAVCKLGPPIIRISERESRLNVNSNQVYSLMKVWIEKERDQYELRKIGRTQTFKWNTWGLPEVFITYSIGKYENLKKDLNKIKPYIEYVGHHLTMSDTFNDIDALKSFMHLYKWFNNEGIEIDLDINKIRRAIKDDNMNKEK